ncbi:phenylalanine 4-monooxygenase [Flammeovirgaceae bacterium SG7u.111]|nr:phenylalanine 4-monooxygenase [Flammeovirgaceae bacterium SG7u.132]WPO37075.1 phenylalanine 4-monooxygenase [Flammeovirgaceae bacterium SG7u.111]
MLQEYEKYTSEDFEVWKKLVDRQMEQLPQVASPAYLEGISAIGFTREAIPKFSEVNEVLEAKTGWNLEVVKGLIPNKEFFELLKNQRFPASTWFRKLSQLGYLEEPDMFHDVFGHVPLLTNQHFCDFLSGLSEIALRHIENEWAIELVSRLYWYTVEFGLIREEGKTKIYGAGILSSSGESVYCLSNKATHLPYNVTEILATPYIKDKFQEKYWVISSYKELYDSLPKIAEVLENELVKG